jgi:hypothetical protein
MKKSYVYFLAPLIGVIVFFGFYSKASKAYDQSLADQARIVREKKEATLKEEAKNRAKAVQDALEAQEKRKIERKAKEDRDNKERDAREKAVADRNKAGREADKLEAQVKRLDKDIATEKAEIAKIEAEKKSLADEQSFLKDYVKKAEANTLGYSAVLEKIDAADKKWDDYNKAVAAAAAAKK